MGIGGKKTARAEMKKVGLLYATQNANFANKIVLALAASGYDAVLLEGGAGARMAAPKTPLIVIWSSASVVSDEIIAAARQSMTVRGIIPISLGRTPPPTGFEHVWPMDLVGWNHDASDPRWQFVIDEVEIAYRQAENAALDEANVLESEMPISAAFEPAGSEALAPSNFQVAPSMEASADVAYSSESTDIVSLPNASSDFASYNEEFKTERSKADEFDLPEEAESDFNDVDLENNSYRNNNSEASQVSFEPISPRVLGELRKPSEDPIDEAVGLRAPRKVKPASGRVNANGLLVIANTSLELLNVALGRHITPVIMGGTFALFLGVAVMTVLQFAPRNSDDSNASEGPIVAFVEPTDLPRSASRNLDVTPKGSPREVFPPRKLLGDGFAEKNPATAMLSSSSENSLPMGLENQIAEAQPALELRSAEITLVASQFSESSDDPDLNASISENESLADMMAASDDFAAPRLKPLVNISSTEEKLAIEDVINSVNGLQPEQQELATLIAKTVSSDDAVERGVPSIVPALGDQKIVQNSEDAIAELTWNAVRAEEASQFAISYFKECVDCPDMVNLPKGVFLMGSPPSEASRRPVEGPQAEIKINRSFAISTKEVTFDQWDACVQDGGCRGYKPFDAGWGRGRRPVINVSYNDALAFCKWLSARTGITYRLPSEAEWEYAARAGTNTPFWFGVSLSPTNANFHGEFPYSGPAGRFRRQTTAVASFEASPFGLYDMHGNVREWTADCWTENHVNASVDSASRGGDCTLHAVKGGAWNTGGWRLRSAHRYALEADERTIDTGFRVVRDSE